MTLATKLFHQQWKSFQVLSKFTPLRSMSITESTARRNHIFDEEKKRQQESIGRIEKIEVRYLGLPEDVTLMMNKDISTPYNCAQHMTEGHCKRSSLALIDGNIPWDMHRPLKESCTLQLLNFTVADPHWVNKAFWRSCSFMLGAALQESFKEEAGLQLHSFPGPNIKSGSFVHDIYLSAKGWTPANYELRAISAEMVKLAAKNLNIERLDVNGEMAMSMFEDNRYKKEQLPSILSQNQGRVALYRVGTHIDISRGPMIASTGFLGRCTIAAVHEVAKEGDSGSIYRVQGVALPTGIIVNHVAYGILEKRAKKINPARLPTEHFEEQTTEQSIA